MAHVYYLADAKELLRAGVDGFAHMVRDVELDEEFLRLAKERNVFQAAALAIQAKPVESGWLQDPAFRRAASPDAIARLERGDTGLPGAPTPEQTEAFKALMRKNVSKLKGAGIRIALGGDTGIPTRFVGYNEHLELQALVDAGLSPLEAITAGTKVGAEILKLDDLGDPRSREERGLPRARREPPREHREHDEDRGRLPQGPQTRNALSSQLLIRSSM